MRLIGLDVGDRRIGIASGDTDSGLAVPAGAIERTKTQADVQAVLAEVTSRDAELIVVGMPVSMNGHIGPQAESVASFIQILGTLKGLDIVSVDERLSTVEATRRMHEGRASRGKASRGDIDAGAAAVILQSYLDSLRD